MEKGNRFGLCANQCCSTVGANSPDIQATPIIHYCQDCAKLMNDEAISRGEPHPCVVRPNQFR